MLKWIVYVAALNAEIDNSWILFMSERHVQTVGGAWKLKESCQAPCDGRTRTVWGALTSRGTNLSDTVDVTSSTSSASIDDFMVMSREAAGCWWKSACWACTGGEQQQAAVRRVEADAQRIGYRWANGAQVRRASWLFWGNGPATSQQVCAQMQRFDDERPGSRRWAGEGR